MQPLDPLPPIQPLEPVVPVPPAHVPGHRQDVLLLVFFITGTLGLLVRAGYLLVTGILSFDPTSSPSLASSLLDALSMLLCALLLLPGLGYSIKRLKRQVILPAIIPPVKFWQVAVLVFAWVLIVVVGSLIAALFSYGWAVAAPLFLLGISLPIFSLAWIIVGGVPAGSRRRLWSVLGYGLVGGTLGAVLLEYLVVGIAAGLITILASANPQLSALIDQVKAQVANANAGDIQALLTVLAPYLTNPLVIAAILIFAAVLAPLIEEAVKPAVIWFLGKRLRSPSEGFVLGAICGAGFALMEGLMAASGATQTWGFGLLGRAAASLMHIAGSGFVGWGIASARLDKRFGRLALAYLLSVTIHGLWNGSAVFAVYGALRIMTRNMQGDYLGVAFILGAVLVLFLELILLLSALPFINRTLRRSIAPLPSDIIAPLATSLSRESNGPGS